LVQNILKSHNRKIFLKFISVFTIFRYQNTHKQHKQYPNQIYKQDNEKLTNCAIKVQQKYIMNQPEQNINRYISIHNNITTNYKVGIILLLNSSLYNRMCTMEASNTPQKKGHVPCSRYLEQYLLYNALRSYPIYP